MYHITFYKDENKPQYMIPIPYHDQDSILPYSTWEKIRDSTEQFYEDIGNDEFIEKHNSKEQRHERAERYRKKWEEENNNAGNNTSHGRKISRYTHFYLGKIKNATPETITKIGIYVNNKRLQYYIDQYGDNWELVGVWEIEDAVGFEKEIREKYKTKVITTGRDFFYLSEEDIAFICEAAKSLESKGE